MKVSQEGASRRTRAAIAVVVAAGCSLAAAGSAHALSFAKADYADPAPFTATQSIAVGDLDHAHGPDVVVLNQLNTAAGRLDVFLNNGDGTFPSTPSTTTTPICAGGENARNVILGEFDGDSNPDALVLCNGDAVVEHGNGLGGFTNTPTRFTNVVASNPLVVGEFHADGVPELVYRGSGGFVCYQPLSLLATSGTPVPTCDTTGSALNTSALALTRLGSGVKVALGFTGTTGSQSLYILSHSVAGFSSSTRVAGNATELADAISAGDLNGDGNPDIVMGMGSGTTGTIQVYVWGPATGIPPSATPASYTSTIPVNYTAIADLDRDGHPDVVAAGYTATIGDSSGALAVFHGNGDGTLQTPPQSFPLPGLGQQAALSNVGETRLVAVDLNGDGVPDLVAGTDTGFSVLLNTTPAPLPGGGGGTGIVGTGAGTGVGTGTGAGVGTGTGAGTRPGPVFPLNGVHLGTVFKVVDGVVTLGSAANPPTVKTVQTLTSSGLGRAAAAEKTKKPRSVIVGSGQTSTPAGKTRSITATLTRKARKQLARRHSLPVTLSLVATGTDGTRASLTRRITLKLAKPKRAKH